MSRPFHFSTTGQDALHAHATPPIQPHNFTLPAQSRSPLNDQDALPIKLSASAPRAAKIVSRIADAFQVTYTLDVAGVEIGGVKLHEVLDYVSPQDLERFENGEFVEEREVMEALEAERRDEKKARRERIRAGEEEHQELLRSKPTSSGTSQAGSTELTNSATGRHGRARPTYTHLFLKPHARKLKLNDTMISGSTSHSEEEIEDRSANVRSGPQGQAGLVRRRRRKRDPVTGELLPLSDLPPVSHPAGAGYMSPVTGTRSPSHDAPSMHSLMPAKRPRRRRHPITKELMSLGWVYEPEPSDDQHMGGESHDSDGIAIRDLAISPQKASKQSRLHNSQNLGSPSMLDRSAATGTWQSSNLTRSPEDNIVLKPANMSVGRPQKRKQVELDASTESSSKISHIQMPEWPLDSADADNLASRKHKRVEEDLISPPPRLTSSGESPSGRALLAQFQNASQRLTHTGGHATGVRTLNRQPRDLDDSRADNRQPSVKEELVKSNATKPRQRASMIDPIVIESDSEDSESMDIAIDEDEYIVEKILAHHMSHPDTHPAELGKTPVMLYQVRWAGYDETTWEPMESFEDPAPVLEYRQRVGLDGGGKVTTSRKAFGSRIPASHVVQDPQARIVLDQENEIHDARKIMRIVKHRSVMEPSGRQIKLYQIQWKNRQNMTWEPIEKFDDETPFLTYEDNQRLRMREQSLANGHASMDLDKDSQHPTQYSSDSGSISI